MVQGLEYILSAALHILEEEKYEHQPKNIKNGYVICGRRHHNCFQTLYILRDKQLLNGLKHTQGFITSNDRFVDRKEAYKIACEAKQIDDDINKDSSLISEDLY